MSQSRFLSLKKLLRHPRRRLGKRVHRERSTAFVPNRDLHGRRDVRPEVLAQTVHDLSGLIPFLAGGAMPFSNAPEPANFNVMLAEFELWPANVIVLDIAVLA